jgi:hypothetical protein
MTTNYCYKKGCVSYPIITSNMSNKLRTSRLILSSRQKSSNTSKFSNFVRNTYILNLELVNSLLEQGLTYSEILKYLLKFEEFINNCNTIDKENLHNNIVLLKFILKNGQMGLIQYNTPPKNKF